MPSRRSLIRPRFLLFEVTRLTGAVDIPGFSA